MPFDAEGGHQFLSHACAELACCRELKVPGQDLEVFVTPALTASHEVHVACVDLQHDVVLQLKLPVAHGHLRGPWWRCHVLGQRRSGLNRSLTDTHTRLRWGARSAAATHTLSEAVSSLQAQGRDRWGRGSRSSRNRPQLPSGKLRYRTLVREDRGPQSTLSTSQQASTGA